MADHEPFAGMAQEETTLRLAYFLQELRDILTSPAGYDSSQQRLRVTAAIESGTVTTVTTCGTVTTLANIDGRNGSMLINALDDLAWQSAVRDNIS